MNDQVVRKILLAIGGFCRAASLLPGWSTRVLDIPPTRVEQNVFSIGIPGWPWFERVKEKKVEPDLVTYTNRQAYYLVCPSSLSGVVGVSLLIVAWRRRPAAQRPAG